MSQVNKYTNKAAYAADTNRKDTQSAVSYIADEGALVCGGVNIVVDKPSACVGDLAVFDKALGAIRFVKGATLVAAQMPANLVPLAVVYARQGERVLILSLKTAVYNIWWAAPYKVALSGFDLAAGGTFTLRINSTEYSFSYAAGATLADIAALINANATVKSTYGWTATVDQADSRIIAASNTWSPNYALIDVVSGCRITRTTEDKNYQTSLTGMLIDGSSEKIRRKNRVDNQNAGGNLDMFLQCYSVDGTGSRGLRPGSSEIIRENVFTEEANPELAAAYPTYRDYLFAEHMLQYPGAYGALLRDGKTNTAKIGRLRFVDIHGQSAPCYPAAAAALDYGIAVEGATTGLEAGAWWLPSVEELYLLMRDRALTSTGRESDPVNRTLARIGMSTCYASNYAIWTSCEDSFNIVFLYSGWTGTIGSGNKFSQYTVRPVSAL